MASKVQHTSTTGAKKHIKPVAIVVTEFLAADIDKGSGDTYILDDVVRDTTSIAQDDNETTDIDCETSDSPIVSIVNLGKWQFAAEVADTQKSLLLALMGFKELSTGEICAPSTYAKKYVTAAVVFLNDDGATYSAFIMPKLQLNSKLTMESLNSNTARIGLGGTALLAKVGTGATAVQTALYKTENYTMPTTGA